MERTLAMIKPDAVEKNAIGDILSIYEKNGFKVVALKKQQLSIKEAESFYEVHKERPFYGELVSFMTSGPVVAMVLEKENAVKANREIMGATNPAEAAEGTIRKQFATNIEKNAVHGSDSLENAEKEISFFFSSKNLI
ncbi:MAG TPA: nucleoside-diphosphate kinase [Oligoflexia bacterium]|mgnify:CR=1 FL=1|nr:nucleoside-diphosphate kinase [Oligoflexia bacterium]HMR24137.1 nucleoside-diphosphate kinase [Oligoflexia bacterium]